MLAAQVGCRDRPASPPARARDTPALPAQVRLPDVCPPAQGDIRLTSDTIGGLATRYTIGVLWQLCPAARADTVTVGGASLAALRIDAPGATLWAIQTAHDAYDDSLHRAEPATLWAAKGDSLRFPDGGLIPRRAGALRALDSAGVIVVDHGDDGSGSYIVRCRYLSLAMIISNDWPLFADSGVVPLARASTIDTASVWRIEVGRRHPRPAVRQACAAGGAH
jgi:hypothetical protein